MTWITEYRLDWLGIGTGPGIGTVHKLSLIFYFVFVLLVVMCYTLGSLMKGYNMTKREQELLVAAWNIVSDYERYGEVLQHDDNFEYGENSSIIRLSNAIKHYNNEEYVCKVKD